MHFSWQDVVGILVALPWLIVIWWATGKGRSGGSQTPPQQ